MSVYIRELAMALGRQGHLVDMYTRQNDPSCSQCEAIAENVSLIHIPAGGSGHVDKLALYPPRRIFREWSSSGGAKTGAIDIIHSNYWLSASWDTGRSCTGRFPISFCSTPSAR